MALYNVDTIQEVLDYIKWWYDVDTSNVYFTCVSLLSHHIGTFDNPVTIIYLFMFLILIHFSIKAIISSFHIIMLRLIKLHFYY